MKYLLLYLFLKYFSYMHVNAFCPLSFLKNINFHSKLENLPKINMKIIEESSLEKIVSKQIFLNTLYNEIKNNMFDYDYLAYNINNNSQIFLFSFFMILLLKNTNKTLNSTKKLDKIQVKKISYIKNNIRQFIFIFMMIFTKDINSVL